ncbi:hypothetical protein ACO34A_13215 [Rhizobium sp. ACO-34A]|nr:hypothetical protein ACO34A_13215 [Rhizobium sp. ACO-34A]
MVEGCAAAPPRSLHLQHLPQHFPGRSRTCRRHEPGQCLRLAQGHRGSARRAGNGRAAEGDRGGVRVNVDIRTGSLNIISLCTGGYGLDHAVELAIPVARTVCMVEREAYACATLVSAMEAGLVARSPIWSDARTFNGRPWRGAVDGIIGGIPCQPHSLAGKRRGHQDERDLWSIARRIFVQSGAWFFLIENVRGMLSSGGAERVWRDLRRLGLTVEGGLFTASEVGAPHERERLFILAVADSCCNRSATGFPAASRGQGKPAEPAEPIHCRDALDNAIGFRRPPRWYDHGEHDRHQPDAAGEYAVDDTSLTRVGGLSVQPWRQDKTSGNADWASADDLFPPGPDDRENWQAALRRAPELEPAFRRVADGLASRLDLGRVDRLRLLGNGVLPLEGAYALRTLAPRLAARGSAGAAQLVRMMEDAE